MKSAVHQTTARRLIVNCSILVLSILGLTACGGGGGDDSGTVSFTVSASAGANGTISPSTVSVNQNATTSFTVTPDAGYDIDLVNGCGGSLAGNTYTTGAITADCTVSASFVKTYIVNTSAGANGAISPIIVSVNHNATTSFTVAPDAGYDIDLVNGCGGSLLGNTYTTGAITADCTVSASFVIKTYTVNATAGANGIISPMSVSVDHNVTTSFTVTPDAGYDIDLVNGCGGTLAGNIYTTGAITADCTVSASFVIKTYTVTTSAGANGAISPMSVSVDHNAATSFTVAPDAGYDIDAVSGCGGSLAGNTYTTGAITADCTVSASFIIKTYTVDTSAGANGAISPTSVSVDHNAATSFTVTPDTGYFIDAVSGCGGSLLGNTYTTGAITADCTVSASFAVTLDPVAALFSNAANWNDYAQGSSWATAADIACNAASDSACLHGGEARVVPVTGKNSCDGLTAEDDLAAFDWVCDATSGTATFVSKGLADGKYLSDLIDFNLPGFKANALTVHDNALLWGKTPATAWWSNAFIENPAAGSLAAASTIYLISSNTAASYILAAEKVALVIQPGVTLTGTGFASFRVSGETQDYLWLEGSVNAIWDIFGVNLSWVRFSVVRGMVVENASSVGVFLQNTSSHNRLTDVTASNNGDGVVLVGGPQYNVLTGLTLLNNTVNGIKLSDADANALSNVMASNNGNSGVTIDASNNNRLSDVIVSNNSIVLQNAWNSTFSGITASNAGITINDGGNNRFAGITANNSDTGMAFLGSINNTLLGATVSNNNAGVSLGNSSFFTIAALAAANNSTGVYLGDSPANSDNTLSDTAAGNNDVGISLSNVDNNTFTGLLEVGDNLTTDCSVVGGTDPGLVDSTCAINGTSDHTLVTGISLASTFVGKVAADAVNTSDSNGTAGFPSDPDTFDWGSFDNSYRGWGIDGSVDFPGSVQRNQWTSGTGRIWDWSLSLGDIGNSGSPALLGVLTLPTGNDTVTHVWSGTPGTPDNAGCNAMVTGSIYNAGSCETTFLRHAMEIQGDELGNDNTLCESGETCLYMPNIGSYLGHGNLASAGAFTPGTLTGITLMQYESNGY